VRVWDAVAGYELATITGHDNWVVSVRWSPSAARLATACYDETVRVWDALTGDELATLSFDTTPRDVAWSPDDTAIAVALKNHWRIIQLG
jgi:WD40 repeat protein